MGQYRYERQDTGKTGNSASAGWNLPEGSSCLNPRRARQSNAGKNVAENQLLMSVGVTGYCVPGLQSYDLVLLKGGDVTLSLTENFH